MTGVNSATGPMTLADSHAEGADAAQRSELKQLSPTDTTELVRRLEDRAAGLRLDGYEIVPDAMDEAAALIQSQAAALAEKDGLIERLRREAEQWAQEARTQQSSLHEAYQAVTGATGEPGDWNGAEPIKRAFAKQAEKIEGLRKALQQIALGVTPTPAHGHYLAHREAVKIARAALSDGEV